MVNGNTVREHLERVYAQTHVMPEQLENAPEIPEGGVSVWDAFTEVSNYARQFDGMIGEKPVLLSDIRDWEWMSGVALEQWEIKAILAIDRLYIKSRKAET